MNNEHDDFHKVCCCRVSMAIEDFVDVSSAQLQILLHSPKIPFEKARVVATAAKYSVWHL